MFRPVPSLKHSKLTVRHWNLAFQKERIVSQPPFFRGCKLGGCSFWIMMTHGYKQLKVFSLAGSGPGCCSTIASFAESTAFSLLVCSKGRMRVKICGGYICSMYGIFAYIWHEFTVNVGMHSSPVEHLCMYTSCMTHWKRWKTLYFPFNPDITVDGTSS